MLLLVAADANEVIDDGGGDGDADDNDEAATDVMMPMTKVIMSMIMMTPKI